MELARRVDAVASPLGYMSRSDFVRDAVRRFLDQVASKPSNEG